MHTKYSNSKIAFTLLLIALSFIPSNSLYAQGPNAPEAGAFEPVDATDMVNLKTGDMTYTIPVINIPGSNGGYPLALSYHAGIATEQESSWVGLGWSLNPGAINRSVNRLPDDWRDVKVYDYYWNEGKTYRQHTIGVYIPLKVVSIGASASWGSLRGAGGSVSIGLLDGTGNSLSLSMGTNGIGIQYGAGHFSIGGNFDPMNDSYGFNAGLRTTHSGLGMRMGIGYNNHSGVSGSVGLNYSHTGGKSGYGGYGSIGLTSSGAMTYSIGASLATKNGTGSYTIGSGGALFTSSIKENDWTIEQSGYTIPLFFVRYTYEKVKVYLDETKLQYSTGSLYESNFDPTDFSNNFCEDWARSKTLLILPRQYRSTTPHIHSYYYNIYLRHYNSFLSQCIDDSEGAGFEFYAKADNYENINGSATIFNAIEFDNYSVSGQGMTGYISPKFNGNPNMYSYDSGEISDLELVYFQLNDQVDRNEKVEFSFKTDLTHKSQINPVSYIDNPTASSLNDFIQNPANFVQGEEKSGKYVEYHTYAEVSSNPNIQMPEGFVKPSGVDDNSIAGFSITSTDGITYHYMLPVYNHLQKTRKVSARVNKHERTSYSESTKGAYATHWLLTAVTGPDYFDKNATKRPDVGDYGYWVNFDYGKWSDGMVWRNPTDLSKSHALTGASYLWGIKDVYYLDKINTNTHTALFLKNSRDDAKGVAVNYIDKHSSLDKTLPSEKQLLLDKILLLKNEDVQGVSKQNVTSLASESIFSFFDPRSNETHTLNLSLQNNVLDINDTNVNQSLIDKSLSVLDFVYDYSLAPSSPNTDANGKLTLKKLYTKGRGGNSIVPPYQFFYDNNPTWNYRNTNVWGYAQDMPEAWSLNRIKLPIGGEIEINYQPDVYESLSADEGQNRLNFQSIQVVEVNENTLKARAGIGNYNISVGDVVDMSYHVIDVRCNGGYASGCPYPYNQECSWFTTINFKGPATLTSLSGKSATFEANITSQNYEYRREYKARGQFCSDYNSEGIGFASDSFQKESAGIAVSSVSVSDNAATWSTEYSYKKGNVPYEPVYDKNVRNQFFLASPIVLYPEVTVTKYDANHVKHMSSVYEFTTHLSEKNKNPNLYVTTTNTQNLNDRLGYDNVFTSETVINDYQSKTGLLKSVTHKDKDNRTIYREENNYVTAPPEFVNSEAYQLYKAQDLPSGSAAVLNSTVVNHHPTVLESKTTISGSQSTAIRYENLDPYTGSSLITYGENSKGLSVKNEIIPARHKYVTMGSKKDNVNYANMLDQTVASYSWVENQQSGNYELVSVGIQTWHDQWVYRDYKGLEANAPNNVWRKHKSYVWKGTGVGLNANGTIADEIGATSFSWWNNVEPPINSGWEKISEIEQYNRYSAIIQASDINNDKSAIKYNVDNTKIIATANTSYKNFYYAGFENYSIEADGFSGEINTINTTPSFAHTGRRSALITGNWNAIRNNDFETGKYLVSIWSLGSITVKVNNQLPDEKVVAGSWTLNYYYLDLIRGNNLVVSGSGFIDDFRMRPMIGTSMKCFVYDDYDQLSHIINDDGLATKYDYDPNGSLSKVWQEVTNRPGLTGGFKKASTHERKYKN